MAFTRLGIIGGSGLGQLLGSLGSGTSQEVWTPFGPPSGPIVTAQLSGVPVALLQRHGPGHRFNPSTVPYRANIYALKKLGVSHILASAAAGSLREEIAPGELVVVDQLIDRTFRRANTFFEDLAVHVEFADPMCSSMGNVLVETGKKTSTRVHARGTYVCMEGPLFSTRAESLLHRSWGADLIGMTALPESKLAREAEICYQLMSLPTDYDSWRPRAPGQTHADLLKEIIGNLSQATERALELIRLAVPAIAEKGKEHCSCQSALQNAVWTDKAHIAPEVKESLGLLLGKYI